MKIPNLSFSKWFQWKDRNKLENSDYAGVYILAKFQKAPEGNANPGDKNIIYVGETCNNSLQGRWYQFNRSAFESKDGHSGGWSYNETFNDDGKDLFVAAMPISGFSKDLRHLFIRYVERKIIFEYALNSGQRPILNNK